MLPMDHMESSQAAPPKVFSSLFRQLTSTLLRKMKCTSEDDVLGQPLRHDAGVRKIAGRGGALARQLVLRKELGQSVQDEEQPEHLVQSLQ